MKKNSTVFIVLLFFSCMNAFAQEWSREDSLWLKNVLEGKEKLKINEDTKKAIDEGRLIVPQWMRDNDSYTKPELEKDFDDTGVPDSIRFHRIDPYTMPPGVFALYVLYMEEIEPVYQAAGIILTDEEIEELKALQPPGKPRDFNRTLSMLFSSHYRQLERNKKTATAYKDYYDAGAIKPIRISEHERKQLNQAVNSRRPAIKVTAGQKINGIDN